MMIRISSRHTIYSYALFARGGGGGGGGGGEGRNNVRQLW